MRGRVLQPSSTSRRRAGLVLAGLALAAAALLPAQAAGSPAAGRADPWARVAKRLTMPVYRPTVTLGFRVASVTLIVADPGCVNDGREQLRAIYYAKKAGRYLEIHEGHPRYCSDTAIDAPVIGRPKVGARRAELYDLCARRDCTGTFGSFALEWCARGTTITLLGVDARSSDLLRIARGMRPADTAAARPCVPPSR